MVARSEMKQVRVGFFHCSIDQEDKILLSSIFEKLIAKGRSTLPAKDYGRDHQKQLRDLSFTNGCFYGTFAKLRYENIPTVASAGGQERDIPLQDEEGLMEKSYFLFHPQYQVLAFQQNRHCGTANQLAHYFTTLIPKSLGDNPLVFNPILLPDAWDRLLDEGSIIQKLDLKVAAPKNRDYFPPVDFAETLLETMTANNGAYLAIDLSANLRSRDESENRLDRGIIGKVRRLLGEGESIVERARFTIDDGTEGRVIDLLEEHMKSTKMVEMFGRYPASIAIKRVLQEAYHEHEATIQHIFSK